MVLCAASLFANEKIVVVGGGLAGLSAAYRLKNQGRDVELYEARSRVGGRVLSAEIDGQIAELGGQSLNDGGEGCSIRGLIAEMGLEVGEVPFLRQDFFCFEKGELQPAPRFHRPVAMEEIEELAKTARSMEDLALAFLPKDNPLYQIIATRFGAFEGASPEKLAPLYLESLLRFLQPPETEDIYILSSVKGGNSLLPLRLAAALGERLHLGHQLTAVEKKENRYRLLFANGQQCEADILVLAMPCSVYEDISFEEGVIPPEKLVAIRSVRYGTNAKILVPFRDETIPRPLLINHRALGYFVPGHNLLTFYYTGKSSRFTEENLEEIARTELSMAGLGSSFPTDFSLARDEAFADYGKAIVGYSWPNDPYAKGSYTIPKKQIHKFN